MKASAQIVVVLLLVAFALSECTAMASGNPENPAGQQQAPDQKALIASLQGTKWQLIDLCGKPPVPDSQATLEFSAADKVSGRGSVNRFGGAIAVADGKLKMGPFMVTRMAGPENLMAQEQAYLEALAKATRLALSGDSLTVTVDGSQQPLRFTRK